MRHAGARTAGLAACAGALATPGPELETELTGSTPGHGGRRSRGLGGRRHLDCAYIAITAGNARALVGQRSRLAARPRASRARAGPATPGAGRARAGPCNPTRSPGAGRHLQPHARAGRGPAPATPRAGRARAGTRNPTRSPARGRGAPSTSAGSPGASASGRLPGRHLCLQGHRRQRFSSTNLARSCPGSGQNAASNAWGRKRSR
jgi:hypothetical protein